jgi:hypothetical protein
MREFQHIEELEDYGDNLTELNLGVVVKAKPATLSRMVQDLHDDPDIKVIFIRRSYDKIFVSVENSKGFRVKA